MRDLGQSEIQNFGVAALRGKTIGWHDVAVDDALIMGCIQPLRNLVGQIENRAAVKGAAT